MSLDENIIAAYSFTLVPEDAGELKTEVDVEAVKKAFKDAGYIRIPTGQNVTISTGDNEGGKLMTEQEWREKFSKQQ